MIRAILAAAVLALAACDNGSNGVMQEIERAEKQQAEDL